MRSVHHGHISPDRYDHNRDNYVAAEISTYRNYDVEFTISDEEQ
jgi:hypothetical protein